MPLSVGQKLGPYEIAGPLGAGGMGEVYRARDTRLEREVALKVLPAEVSRDPERRQRFEQEARAVAALNHPNIVALYDVGEENGVLFLVTELVEGRNLKGPMPLDGVLKCATQIADALQAAHDRGIVHRDLKPGNIMLRVDGVIKLLDFGLAKTLPAPSSEDGRSLLSTETLGMTQAGVVMGTAAYMSPEQAQGLYVDKRTDIWAFGVVLYELLTGRRPFPGSTLAETLANVLKEEPDWERVPAAAQRMLRRCLVKDPARRLRDIGETRFLWEEDLHAAVPAPGNRWRWKASTAILTILLVTVLVFFWISRRQTEASVMRFSADLGDDATLAPRRGTSIVLSPDGSQVVFMTGEPLKKTSLALLRLDQTKALPLAGTEGAEAPFFSADGKSIAFFADGKLKKTDTAGSAPVTLCDAPSQREGSWGDDNNIVFAATNQGGLSRVPSSGGMCQPVTELDKQRGEWTHRFPQVLPGAQAVLFATGADSTGEANIDVLSFQTGRRKTLVEAGAYGHYLPSGHLIYMHRGTLMAAPMDLGRLELTGPAVRVLEDVSFRQGTGAAGFTFSNSGTFVYVAANPEEKLRPISVVDQNGKVEMLPVPPAAYARPHISPDGTRLAVTVDDTSGTNISVYDWAAQRLSRLTVMNGNSDGPVWTPDGKNLVFYSDAQSPGPGIYWTRADGGTPQRLLEGSGQTPRSFSPGAAKLSFDRIGAKAGIWMLPLDWSDAAGPKAGIPELLVDSTGGLEADRGTFSPDGRWVAYQASPFGLPEVFVRPFSRPAQLQISAGGRGGEKPAWSRDGRTLFYQDIVDSHIRTMEYSVVGESFLPGPARAWSETQVSAFDLMPDGKHIVEIPSPPQKASTHAIFLLNFFDELRQKVPVGK